MKINRLSVIFRPHTVLLVIFPKEKIWHCFSDAVFVELIVNRGDHPWCKENLVCFRFIDGEIERHSEWLKVLGKSGLFMFEAGQMFADGSFDGDLYTVGGDDQIVTTDGRLIGKVASDALAKNCSKYVSATG